MRYAAERWAWPTLANKAREFAGIFNAIPLFAALLQAKKEFVVCCLADQQGNPQFRQPISFCVNISSKECFGLYSAAPIGATYNFSLEFLSRNRCNSITINCE